MKGELQFEKQLDEESLLRNVFSRHTDGVLHIKTKTETAKWPKIPNDSSKMSEETWKMV